MFASCKAFTTKSFVLLYYYSCHLFYSCPVVVKKDTLVSINSKTPALATPLIRVILRLWCHECTRVFSDRLIGEDKLWFSSTLHSVALEHFCETSLDSSSEGTVQYTYFSE
jgi:hypothetical protein